MWGGGEEILKRTDIPVLWYQKSGRHFCIIRGKPMKRSGCPPSGSQDSHCPTPTLFVRFIYRSPDTFTAEITNQQMGSLAEAFSICLFSGLKTVECAKWRNVYQQSRLANYWKGTHSFYISVNFVLKHEFTSAQASFSSSSHMSYMA
jgi:hypothetical protein